MEINHFSFSHILPILVVSAIACSPAIKKTELPSPNNVRNTQTDTVLWQAVEDLRERLEKAGEIIDPRLVVCDKFPGDVMLDINAFDELISGYFTDRSSVVEGTLHHNFEVYCLVKTGDRHQVFTVNECDIPVDYFRGRSDKAETICEQVVPRENIAAHIKTVDLKGKDATTWFDELYNKTFPKPKL